MAQNFKVKQLILNNQDITTTGNRLYVGGNTVAYSGESSSLNLVNGILDISGFIAASGANFSNRAWSYLTWNNTTTWNANFYTIEDRKILVMTGNTILVITGLYNGWAGLLQTIQSGNAASGYGLSMQNVTKVMNAGSGIINLTSGSGVYDMIGFQYDGNNLFANVGNQFT